MASGLSKKTLREAEVHNSKRMVEELEALNKNLQAILNEVRN